MTEPVATTATDPRRRGRPRPDETISRDEQIFELLTEPRTKAQLMEATGLPAAKAYLSLHRLKVAGRVIRVAGDGGGYVWQRTA